MAASLRRAVAVGTRYMATHTSPVAMSKEAALERLQYRTHVEQHAQGARGACASRRTTPRCLSGVRARAEAASTWRNIALFVGFPTCLLVALKVFLEDEHEAHAFVSYEHLRIRRKVCCSGRHTGRRGAGEYAQLG